MNDDDPFRWICLRSHASRQPINEAALVLTAMGIDNYVELEAGEWCLFIRQGHRPAAVDQLERYRAENVPPRVRIPRIITFDSGWAGVFGYLLVIWSVPALAWWGMFGADWQGAGLLQAGLVAQGEWWRAVTALTLHSSFPHLVANSLFGVVFGLMAGRYLGSGFAWLLILLGGVFGNLLNAWARPDEFRSLGASTATFAAVGLIAAFVWRRGYFRGRLACGWLAARSGTGLRGYCPACLHGHGGREYRYLRACRRLWVRRGPGIPGSGFRHPATGIQRPIPFRGCRRSVGVHRLVSCRRDVNSCRCYWVGEWGVGTMR